MFWNDPTLYSATLPYKDITMQAPQFLPWQNVQRPLVGYGSSYFGVPTFPQFIPQVPQFGIPQVPQFGVHPYFQMNPYTQMWNLNPYQTHRPFSF